jgi:hypothetical protein
VAIIALAVIPASLLPRTKTAPPAGAEAAGAAEAAVLVEA